MSLSKLRKITDDGVTFQSHIDGSRHELTPERAVEIQCLLGSDIQMQLDECVALPASHEETERAMERSLAWAARCQAAFAANRTRAAPGPGQALFGIVQGGIDPDLRRRSAEALVAMDLPGYADRRPRRRRAAGGHDRDAGPDGARGCPQTSRAT